MKGRVRDYTNGRGAWTGVCRGNSALTFCCIDRTGMYDSQTFSFLYSALLYRKIFL